MHPSEAIKGKKSKKLEGKKIILAMTGSIACVEGVKLARELIRHGGDVEAVMSEEACRIVTPLTMEFATGKRVITELSGKVEHINDADLLLIAPCTANTISKIALGIADNAITTMALSFNKKIVIAPAMHISMYENKFFMENMEKCRRRGIEVIDPRIEEGKAKMANVESIVEGVIRNLYLNDLKGKRILIIGGSAHEKIDEVRVIANLSSGRMAVALAREAYERGACVEMWHGKMEVGCIPYIKCKHFETLDGLIDLIQKAPTYDAIINCAALPDFRVERFNGKIPSDEERTLRLFPAERINPMLREKSKILVGFKLEAEEGEIEKRAMDRLERDGLDYIIGNTLESVGGNYARIWIIGREGLIKKIEGKKEHIARDIIDLI